MAERGPNIRLDDKLKAEDRLYESLFHTEDRKIIRWGFAIAVVLHLAFLVLPLPRLETKFPAPQSKHPVVVRKYVPPPPKIERQQQVVVKKQLTRKVPIPDPTPEEPEPIREPEPEIEPEPLPPDAEFVIGEPEPAPRGDRGPLLPGVGGVTYPTRIEEHHVQPVYPEFARKSKIEANVFLNAVVEKDGDVAEVTVLRCNSPGLGFEEASIAAVKQWKYEPATQNGRPVDVFIVVIVYFTLQ